MKTLRRVQSSATPMVLLALLLTAATGAFAAPPIRLHPENPRWFEWRGKAVALITSAEHYGAVLNRDFDFRRYLETLEREGMNYTRVFAGSYVEPAGAFGITRNTLAPASGRFLAPWERSDQPGYAGGGNKFDLDRFSSDYLARLRDFLAEAGRRGIVVELTLFCSTYGDAQWALHPFNPTNHVQGLTVPSWKSLNTLPAAAPAVLAHQLALTRHLVRELNAFDNLIYEIQNEPWADQHAMGDFINPYLTDRHSFPNAVEVTTAESVAWQRVIARAIADEEARLPHRHLIAQNVANFRLALNEGDLVPEASIVNFHYAYPEAVHWNRGLQRVIGYDETGFAGNQDATYRRQAWNFVLSGGGLFNSLDYSFAVGREDGTDIANQAPGGGSPTLRRQLKILSEFLHSFDLATLQPDPLLVQRAPGAVVRALSHPGRAHALYVEGRGPTTLTLKLSKGRWVAEWISVTDGSVLKQEIMVSRGRGVELTGPDCSDGVAVRLLPR
ncbi:MAG: hypothetical protein JNK85_01035 [Verrucomicrobiales bacterium]|nr:hypothetical protein [Verrucomicrobiales bacterium]